MVGFCWLAGWRNVCVYSGHSTTEPGAEKQRCHSSDHYGILLPFPINPGQSGQSPVRPEVRSDLAAFPIVAADLSRAVAAEDIADLASAVASDLPSAAAAFCKLSFAEVTATRASDCFSDLPNTADTLPSAVAASVIAVLAFAVASLLLIVA